MNRSRLTRGLALAAVLLTLVGLPAQAQPRGASIATVASQAWQAFLDLLPGLPMKASSVAAESTTTGDRGAGLDPNGVDRGVDIDPNGTDVDRGVDIDPDGLATNGDRGADLDPNG